VKASELILALQKQIEQHGDLPVVCHEPFTEEANINVYTLMKHGQRVRFEIFEDYKDEE